MTEGSHRGHMPRNRVRFHKPSINRGREVLTQQTISNRVEGDVTPMSNNQNGASAGSEPTGFSEEIKEKHRSIINRYNQFRRTVSGILLLNPQQSDQQYSREELIKRKSQIREQVKRHIETIQSVMLPALSEPDKHTSTEVNILATVQNRLTELLDAANQHFNGLLDETSSQSDRRDVARKVLLDIFRLDSLLKVYLEIVENHYAPLAEEQLDSDEKDEIVSSLADNVS